MEEKVDHLVSSERYVTNAPIQKSGK